MNSLPSSEYPHTHLEPPKGWALIDLRSRRTVSFTRMFGSKPGRYWDWNIQRFPNLSFNAP